MRRYTPQSRKILAVKVYVAMTHKGFVAVSADGSSAWHALVPARQTALASLILSLVNVHNSPPQPGCAYAVEKTHDGVQRGQASQGDDRRKRREDWAGRSIAQRAGPGTGLRKLRGLPSPHDSKGTRDFTWMEGRSNDIRIQMKFVATIDTGVPNQQATTGRRAGAAPGAASTPSGCCSRRACGRPPAACRRR